jgi:hypothetical protein
MFRNKVGVKTRRTGFGNAGFRLGETGRIGLALRRAQVDFRQERWAKMVLYIASIEVAHGGSIRSVA